MEATPRMSATATMSQATARHPNRPMFTPPGSSMPRDCCSTWRLRAGTRVSPSFKSITWRWKLLCTWRVRAFLMPLPLFSHQVLQLQTLRRLSNRFAPTANRTVSVSQVLQLARVSVRERVSVYRTRDRYSPRVTLFQEPDELHYSYSLCILTLVLEHAATRHAMRVVEVLSLRLYPFPYTARNTRDGDCGDGDAATASPADADTRTVADSFHSVNRKNHLRTGTGISAHWGKKERWVQRPRERQKERLRQKESRGRGWKSEPAGRIPAARRLASRWRIHDGASHYWQHASCSGSPLLTHSFISRGADKFLAVGTNAKRQSTHCQFYSICNSKQGVARGRWYRREYVLVVLGGGRREVHLHVYVRRRRRVPCRVPCAHECSFRFRRVDWCMPFGRRDLLHYFRVSDSECTKSHYHTHYAKWHSIAIGVHSLSDGKCSPE